ncbi:hypothetical protein EVAR_3578_1 [Eumeta japonica]|uniref:Uncharacterized protein n=1 Tax=Eumeta variegata TaxID=151549 RepID=A0A4C1SWB3_EUMVA|nr:hypothetical protein EVAR_3578_1 [Eumeta japonica]
MVGVLIYGEVLGPMALILLSGKKCCNRELVIEDSQFCRQITIWQRLRGTVGSGYPGIARRGDQKADVRLPMAKTNNRSRIKVYPGKRS